MKGPISRANIVLAALLAVQVIVLIALPSGSEATRKPSDKDATVAGTKPFTNFDEKAIRSLSVTGENKSIRLESETKKEGDKDVVHWYLADRDRYPAREADVDRIVHAVQKIMYTRVITRQSKRYAGLNVADGANHAHVVATGEGGKVLADFFVGDSRDFGSIYVRQAGDPAVYQAKDAATYDFPTSTSGLVDSAFLEIPIEQINYVKLTSGADTLEVMKEKELPASAPSTRSESQPETKQAETKPATPRWVTVGEKPEVLDTSKVESWLRGIGKLSLSEPIGKTKKPEQGFEKPTATATIRTLDGKETVITIGAERKDERDYFATATGKDFIVTIASYNVTDYFQKKQKDLVAGATPGEEK